MLVPFPASALHQDNQATLVAFEEPENGVHPACLKIVGAILKNAAESGKQVIVTTDSSVLPTYFTDRSLFVCRKKDDRTTIFVGRPAMIGVATATGI